MIKLKHIIHDKKIGVTITGIDLAENLSVDTILEIQYLLNKYKVVIFNNQNLLDEKIGDFAFKFGSPFTPDSKYPVLGSQDSSGPIVIVGNQASEFPNSYLGCQEVLPHSDHQWLKNPSSASLLYAIDIQENSANTFWYDMTKAYQMLDSEIKSTIDKLNIITYNPFYRPFGTVSSKYVNREKDIPLGNTFPHPLVRTHPLTHQKILYMNIAYEIEFENLSYNEGNKLFNKLSEYISNFEYKYEHVWKNGDVVLWDNRSTIHYRPSFDTNVRRVLKRLTIGGEIPF